MTPAQLEEKLEELLMGIVADSDFIEAQLGAKAITKKVANKTWLDTTAKYEKRARHLIYEVVKASVPVDMVKYNNREATLTTSSAASQWHRERAELYQKAIDSTLTTAKKILNLEEEV